MIHLENQFKTHRNHYLNRVTFTLWYKVIPALRNENIEENKKYKEIID